MGLLGVCSSVLVSFHLALKSLFGNSKQSYQSVFTADFRAGSVCMAERWILAGKPRSGSVRRGEHASKATPRSWRWIASVSVSALYFTGRLSLNLLVFIHMSWTRVWRVVM